MHPPSVKKVPSFKSMRGTTSRSAIPRQKTVYAGWLWMGKGARSQLNRRWFVIKGDQMYYFKSNVDAYAIDQIPLAGNEIIKHNNICDANGRYVFELIAGKERQGRPVVDNCESILFGAQSLLELDEWVKAINRVIYSPMGGGMFGRSISETVRSEASRGGGMVPIVVEKCVNYLRAEGLMQEGLFRVPGNQNEVEEMKNALNKGEDVDFQKVKPSVNLVASLLKQYIADLPDPVVPKESFDQFIAVTGIYKTDPGAVLEKVKYLLQRLPVSHFNLLKYICRFLFELRAVEENTKMSLGNLATVFGPILLRPTDEDPVFLIKSLGVVNSTLKILIENEKTLFPETRDEKYMELRERIKENEASDLNEMMQFKNPLISFSSEDEELLSPERRSFSEGSLLSLKDEVDVFTSPDGCQQQEKVLTLQDKIESLKQKHAAELREVQHKLNAEIKIREMLQIRLEDEQRARIEAEESNRVYKDLLEKYCNKFGNIEEYP